MKNEEKYRKIVRCMDKWMSNLEKGKEIADYLNYLHILSVGIYGYGMLGKHLVRELQKKAFLVSWVIDKSVSGDEVCSNILRPDSLCSLEDVDLVVITSMSAVEDIEAFLLKNVRGRIISIEELIDSIFVWRK